MITLSVIVSGLILAAIGYQLIGIWHLHQSTKGKPAGPVTGVEALVGISAEVIEAFKRAGPQTPALGRVRIGGESWQAELVEESGRLVKVGETVRVVGSAGMVLKVVRG